MATIFYFENSGKIYGVHPDLATAPPLPQGVVHIEVPGTSDKIPWPEPEPGVTGKEQSSRVNPVTKLVELSVPPLSPEEQKRKNARDKMNQAIAEPGIPQKIKDAFAALKDLLT